MAATRKSVHPARKSARRNKTDEAKASMKIPPCRPPSWRLRPRPYTSHRPVTVADAPRRAKNRSPGAEATSSRLFSPFPSSAHLILFLFLLTPYSPFPHNAPLSSSPPPPSPLGRPCEGAEGPRAFCAALIVIRIATRWTKFSPVIYAGMKGGAA